MKQYPSIPHAETAADEFFEGHLWLVEKVDGALLRFQLQESGLIRFGDRDRVYDDSADVPEPYQHAVRHVQQHFDRSALRDAVETVEDVVFFGESTHHHAIDYDWDRTPSFLGFDIWDGNRQTFRSVDTTEQIFDRLGLSPVHVFEREYNARDFELDSYTIPQSAYYDGPAAGVIIRNKRGQRAKLHNSPIAEPTESVPDDASATTLAQRYATRDRFEQLVDSLETQGQPATFDLLYERVFEEIVREKHTTLFEGEQHIDVGAFRSEVAALTRAFLEQREQ